MDLISFLLGKKYGEAKNKKEKQKVLVYIAMLFFIPFLLILLFIGDWFLITLSVISIVFLYLKFLK